MTTAQTILALTVLFIGLWVAYKIGKVILRITIGLLVLAFIAFAAYHIFLR